MPKQNLIDEYLELQKHYSLKYGDKTILLMEVGSFYEIYAVTPQQHEVMKDVCQLTALRISRKNNKNNELNITSGNPYMAGFTSIAFSKYMKILISHNYTVVKMDQITPPPNPKRGVTRIFSPGTYWDTEDTRDQCYIMGIFITGHHQLDSNKMLYSIGLSMIDVSTGESNVIELHDQKTNQTNMGVLAEMYKFVYNYQPIEIIISYQDDESIARIIYEKLNQQFDKVHYIGEVKESFIKPNYQDIFLRKYFPCISSVNTIDYIGLDKYTYSLISYLQLIDFTYEHESLLIKSLPKPLILSDNHLLNISYQSMETLDIISHDKKKKTLSKLLDKCCTRPGKRRFLYNLRHPITDPNELNERYNKIERLIPIYKEIEGSLKKTYDIQRLHRKLLIQHNVKPYEFSLIHQTYCMLNDIITFINKQGDTNNILEENSIKMYKIFKDYQSVYLKTLNIDVLNKFNMFSDITENIFNFGVEKDLDSLFTKKKNIMDELIDFKNRLSLLTNDSKKKDNDLIGNIKLDCNEKDGYYLKLTKTRCKELKKNLGNINSNRTIFGQHFDYLSRLTFKEKSSEVIITSIDINNYSNKLIELDSLIHDKSKCIFLQYIQEWFQTYKEQLDWISDFLAKIDDLVGAAKMASSFNYCKPYLKNNSASGIEAKDIRHPILERLNSNSVMVSNDIEIGSLSDKNGMLITGLNGVGKSIYIKSIALCIILAQSGYFVPATTFEYVPYHNLFTRIGNVDNLFKGQSTFYCEMLELDEILRNSNQHTLVVADELCSGSEQFSAQSILASTIIELENLKSNFLLTTHFHRSLEIPEIVNLNLTQFYHFSIQYDKDNQSIIYNRKLKKGVGEKLYGIEVCQNIIQNKGFLNRCFDIRNNLIEESRLINNKPNKKPQTSKYNSSLIIEQCHICGKKNNPEGSLDTHHIKEQQYANSNGYILEFHKNNLDNLVVLCKEHHHQVHHGNLVINGWKDTLDRGRILDYEIKSEYTKKKKYKYSKDDIKKVLSVKIKVGSKSKSAKYILEKEYGFKKISETTIKKIWNHSYF